MADDTQVPDKQSKGVENSTSTEGTPVKRRLRSTSETMRERSEKLQNQEPKSNHPVARGFRSFWRGFTWPLRALGRLLARLGRFLGKYKFFRVIGYIFVPPYIRGSWRELKLVTWPNFVQSWRLTYAVLIFSVIFGVVVAILDFGLDKVFKEIFTK